MRNSVGAFQAATGRTVGDGEDKPRYRAYQYELIAPYCGSSVLEVGAGDGNFSALLAGRERVVATDVDPDAVAAMSTRFHGTPGVQARHLDLEGDPTLGPPVETVVAINVLEHFERDASTLRAMSELLTPGGRVVLWVPGYQQLYGDFDRSVGHYRRYTPASLRAAIRQAGLTPAMVKPVNLLGGLAWWAMVRRGGTGGPRPRLVQVYEHTVVPVSRLLDRHLRVPFGQSVLGVAEVPH
jgi:SAM-dependent methyltransferase